MSREHHPSFGNGPFRVVCSDGEVMVDEIPTLDEAEAIVNDLSCDEFHEDCESHVIELFAGWVPIGVTR